MDMYVLKLKPIMNDQTGHRQTEKQFVIDNEDGALSAGLALQYMLDNDPSEYSDHMTPMFRDDRTNQEITYEYSAGRLKEALEQAAFPELASEVHCLHIGGATAYANYPEGGDLIAGFMGLWLFDCK